MKFFILTLGSHCSCLPSARTADLSVLKEISTQEKIRKTVFKPVLFANVKANPDVYAFLIRGLNNKSTVGCATCVSSPWFVAMRGNAKPPPPAERAKPWVFPGQHEHNSPFSGKEHQRHISPPPPTTAKFRPRSLDFQWEKLTLPPPPRNHFHDSSSRGVSECITSYLIKTKRKTHMLHQTYFTDWLTE